MKPVFALMLLVLLGVLLVADVFFRSQRARSVRRVIEKAVLGYVIAILLLGAYYLWQGGNPW